MHLMKSVNLLLVGAEKSGTTSVHSILANHPKIYTSHIKEFSYFNDFDSNGKSTKLYQHQNISWYNSFFESFESQSATYRLESSPLYMESPDTLKRIKDILGDVKIICILRDPAERYLSNVQMSESNGDLKFDHSQVFSDPQSLLYLNRGEYSLQIAWLKKNFSDICILDFDDLKSNPNLIKKQLSSFLEIDSFDDTIESFKNKSHSRKFPFIYKSKRYLARLMRSNKFFSKSLDNSFIRFVSRLIDRLNTSKLAQDNKSVASQISKRVIMRYYEGEIIKLRNLQLKLKFMSKY